MSYATLFKRIDQIMYSLVVLCLQKVEFLLDALTVLGYSELERLGLLWRTLEK